MKLPIRNHWKWLLKEEAFLHSQGSNTWRPPPRVASKLVGHTLPQLWQLNPLPTYSMMHYNPLNLGSS